jgi:mono/diheme cytochrome c family protein
VLDGIDGRDGLPRAMPGFRDKLTDADITAATEYIRTLRTNALGWPDLLKDVGRIRANTMPQP